MENNSSSPNNRLIRRFDKYGPLVAMALSAVYLISYWNYGPNLSDDGVFIEPALDILEGGIFYRDFIPVYGPIQYFLLTLFFKLFGISYAAYRALFITIQVISAPLFFKLSRKFVGPVGTSIATLVFILVPGNIHKSPMALGAVGFAWFAVYIARPERIKNVLWAALLTIMILLTRLDLGLFAITLTALSMGINAVKNNKFKRAFISFSIYLAAVIALFFIFAPLLGPETIQYHYDMRNVVLKGQHGVQGSPFPLLFSDVGIQGNWPQFFSFLSTFAASMLLGGIYVVVTGARKRFENESDRNFVLLYAASGMAFFLFFFAQSNLGHFLRAAPLLYILAALLFHRVYRHGRFFKVLSSLSAAFLVSLFLYYIFFVTVNQATGSAGQIRHMKGVVKSKRGDLHFFEHSSKHINALIQYIDERQNADETVIIVPHEATLYFLMGKRNRVCTPIFFNGIYDLAGHHWEDCVFKTLANPKTRHIIYNEPPLYHEVFRGESKRFVNTFPQFFDIIMKNFKFDEMIGPYMILERTSVPDPATKHFFLGYEDLKYGKKAQALEKFHKAHKLGMSNSHLDRLIKEAEQDLSN